MKNIHILPTEGESNLFYADKGKELCYTRRSTFYSTGIHVYITSDEEIKEGDWCMSLCDDESYEEIYQCNNIGLVDDEDKKIILTTDTKLIADGVQEIDDEFLEWFVKNPTCEFVEVSELRFFDPDTNKSAHCKWEYDLPQEEPKTNLEILPFPKLVEEFVKYYKQVPLVDESKQEIWKDIPNYEGLYQVSNFGNVKSLERYVKGKVENRLQKENILSKRLVGNLGNQYYAVTLCNNKDRKQIKVSVLVAMAFLNHTPNGYVGFTVDHIDNNPLNNNVDNLQVITKRENSSKDRKGISKYTGVTFNKKSNKWRSQIWINGKNKTLGSFDDELEAHRAYQKELQQHLKS
jgi:hypothetical protein